MSAQKTKAEAAYEDAHAEAHATLARIAELLHEMPAPGAESKINWGHVGDVGHVNELLSRVRAQLDGTHE